MAKGTQLASLAGGEGFSGIHTKETIERIRKNNLGINIGIKNHMSIPIKIVDLLNENYSAVFHLESFSLAYRFLNTSKATFFFLARKKAAGKPFVIKNRWLIIIDD